MGIQRKNPKLNWLSSFGLIITAGSIYRLRNIGKRFFSIQTNQFLKDLGYMFIRKPTKAILQSQVPLEKGDWEKIITNRLQLTRQQKIVSTLQRVWDKSVKKSVYKPQD